MIALSKKIISFVILVSFMVLVFFGLAIMMHGTDQSMPGDCPLSSVMGESLCPQNTLALAVHHLATYQSFLQVTINIWTSIILVLLFVSFILFIYIKSPNQLGFLLRTNIHYNPPLISIEIRKIISWLSLFENSPSSYMGT